MRNLSDQYQQQENRLTHALAVCLHEDPALLRAFLGWVKADPPAGTRKFAIVEQGLPGDAPESEQNAEERGLPDIVIHDDDRWCLIVESKVQARLTADQLHRHERTLHRRGFTIIRTVVLTKAGVPLSRSHGAIAWASLYAWLGNAAHGGRWSERLRDYLRVSDVRLAREEYLTEGTLTMFDGFPFSADNPYTYGEAKRLLKLALTELRTNPELTKLGVDSRGAGRPAITGKAGKSVWDFLPLRDRPKGDLFTKYPHLTLSIREERLDVAVTIPNGVNREVRRRFAALAIDGLVALNGRILRAAKRLPRGATIHAYALQRHYLTQRSAATEDARVEFKLETSRWRRGDKVKYQPEWIALFAELLRHKRSNIQFGYSVHLPWDADKRLATRQSLALITEAWTVLASVLDVARGLTRAKR